MVKKEIPAYQLPINTQLESVAVTIQLAKKLNICNVYIPPNKDFYLHDINNLLNQIPSPRLIIGDFNSHHISWNSLDTNLRGQILYDAIEKTNLVICK
jgi:hypothetical protein